VCGACAHDKTFECRLPRQNPAKFFLHRYNNRTTGFVRSRRRVNKSMFRHRNFVNGEITSIHAALALIQKLTCARCFRWQALRLRRNVVSGCAARASAHSDVRFSLDYFFQ